MARPVFENVEEVAREGGLSRRLAARIGALARDGLYISDVVLELLSEADSKPLETLLLLPALPAKAKTLTSDELENLLRLVPHPGDFFAFNKLALIRQDSLSCIALADESDHLEGLPTDEPAPPPTKAPSTHGLIPVHQNTGTSLSRFVDPSVSFDASSLGELKLTLLTSTHTDQKIEALRRIWLSPVGNEEKAQLLLIALRDRDAALRAEASRGLATFGVHARLSENLSKACVGKESSRIVALSNLKQITEELTQEELSLCFRVVCELLDGDESDAFNASVVEALRNAATHLDTLPDESLARLMQGVQDLLHIQRATLLQPLRRLLIELGSRAAQTISGLILAALQESTLPHLRSFLLSILPTLDHSDARSPQSVSAVIQAVLTSNDLDPSYANLTSGLSRFGSNALGPLREVFESTSTENQLRLLPVISDFLGSANDAELAESLTATLLDAFDTGTKTFRVAFYESSFLRRWPPGNELARRAARLMLDDIHEHELESFREVISGSILNLGGDIFPEVLQAVNAGGRPHSLITACELLGQITLRWPDHAAVRDNVVAALHHFRTLFDDEDFPDRGILLRTIGRLASHAAVPGTKSESLVSWLRTDLIGRSSLTYDAVEALGWIASGDSIDENLRLEIGHDLLEFLKRDLPKIRGRVREDDEGQILEVGSEASAYTDLIPRLLTIFQRLLLRSDLRLGLWKHIVDTLCGIFERVANFRIIWAPGSTLQLARTLVESCTHAHSNMMLRERVAELILIKESVTQMLILALNVCAEGDSPRMAQLSQEAYAASQRTLLHAEDLDTGEQRELLAAMSGLLFRSQIGASPSADLQARRSILDSLYDGLRRRLPGMLLVLRALADKSNLVRVETEEIKKQISRFQRAAPRS